MRELFMVNAFYFQLSTDGEPLLLDSQYLKQNAQLSQNDAPGRPAATAKQ